MNLNSASHWELTQLPRMGADRTRRIVRYGATRKGFPDWAAFARTPLTTGPDVGAMWTRA